MKTKMLVVGFAALLSGGSGLAQGQAMDEAWVQRHQMAGDEESVAQAVAIDSRGYAIVTGTSENLLGLRTLVTIAYSDAGAPIWTNAYRAPGDYYDGQPNAVTADQEGNAFVSGVTFASFGQDYVTIKYSSTGVPLWTNLYNGPGDGNDGAAGMVVDENGDVIVTGGSVGNEGLSSYFDFATVKYTGAGVPVWTNRYNGPANHGDEGTDIALAPNGGVIVTGISYTSEGDADYVTLAYSSQGVPLWTNRYNGPGNGSDYGRAVEVAPNGTVFVTGDSWGGEEQEWATVAYSSGGMALWTNRYHAEWSGPNFATALAVDAQGNVFVTGRDGGFQSPNGGYATIKYSNAGEALWTNRYNGPLTTFGYNDNARAIAVDPNGNVIVTGQSYSHGDMTDFATIAYSNAGMPLWTNRYNGAANGWDTPVTKNSLAVGADGSVYVTGISDRDVAEGGQFEFVTIKYSGGANLPVIEIMKSGTDVTLSWPSSASEFLLEKRAVAGEGNWTAVEETTMENGEWITVTIPASGEREYFRLRAP